MDYAEWKERRKSLKTRQIRLEESFKGRSPGNRPRDPQKERLLTEMDKRRWERWLETGKLEIVGPRKWIWHIGPPSAFKKEQ